MKDVCNILINVRLWQILQDDETAGVALAKVALLWL